MSGLTFVALSKRAVGIANAPDAAIVRKTGVTYYFDSHTP